MLHVHTIGRIGKDCQVISGAHGSFMAMDIAVDDYSKGQNITTWIRIEPYNVFFSFGCKNSHWESQTILQGDV